MVFDQPGQRRHIRAHPCHIGRSAERHDHTACGPPLREQLGQNFAVRAGQVALRHFDHIRAAFPPRQQVGMVLIRPHQHGVTCADAHQMHQLVQTGCCTRPGENHRMLIGTRATMLAHNLPRPFTQRPHARTTEGRICVGVGVERQHLFHHEHFHLTQRPPGGDVIRIDQLLWAGWGINKRLTANQSRPQELLRILRGFQRAGKCLKRGSQLGHFCPHARLEGMLALSK